MKSYIINAFVGLIFFISGFYFAHHRFLSSGLAVLNSNLNVKSPSGQSGSIPEGTEVHVISSMNGNIELYLFFSMSENEYTRMVEGVENNNKNGVGFLKSTK